MNPFLTPEYIRNNMTEKEARKTYSRLRKNSQRRLKRLGESEFRNTPLYQQNRKGFPVLKDIAPRDLPYYLTQVSDFYFSKSATLRYQKMQKRKNLREFKEKGFNVKESDYWDFIAFLDEWHENNLERLYGSERVFELFENMKEKNIGSDDITRNFEKWLEKSNDLEAIETVRGAGADYYREKLGI